MNVQPGQRAVIIRGECQGTRVLVLHASKPYDALMLLHPFWRCVSLGAPLRAHPTRWGIAEPPEDAREGDVADEVLRPLLDPDQVETIVVDDALTVHRGTSDEVPA